MTREEAIEFIAQSVKSGVDMAKVADALKALEQEPCEDAVSRQAVLDIVDSYSESQSNVEDVTQDIISDIVVLPPVNPQPKTGHWIEHPEIETSVPEYLMFYECSECGDRQCFCKSDIHKKRFCSNCGCRMVEPQEKSGEEEES